MDLVVLRAWLSARFGLHRDERGANLVEYMMLVAFIAIIVVVTIRVMGRTVSVRYSRSNSALSQ